MLNKCVYNCKEKSLKLTLERTHTQKIAMKTKLNPIIFTTLLLMLFTSKLVAQSSNEYATVKYVGRTCWGGEMIYISINGKEVEKIEAKGQNINDDTKTLDCVAKMVNEGWHVIQTTTTPCSPLIFVLERKKQ